jgi:hypothetical protein
MRQNRIILLAPIGMMISISGMIFTILISEPSEIQTYYINALLVTSFIGIFLVFIGLLPEMLGSE